MNKEMTEASAGLALLNTGYEGGDTWRPSEVDVSIRPGWYYHKTEDNKLKSLNKLVDIYFASVGRGSNLLLNIPPDRRGLINENDIKALSELRKYLDACFKKNLIHGAAITATNTRGNSKQFSPSLVADNNKESYWSTDDDIKTASLEIIFKNKTSLNCIEIQEYIALGQRVKSFSIEAFIDGAWKSVTSGATIGYKRLLRFPLIKTTKIKVIILESKACPVISNIAVYNIPELVSSPEIKRNKSGVVSFKTESPQSLIYYTLDGTKPTQKSLLYTNPFELKIKCTIQAISFSGDYSKASTIKTVEFGPCKEKWKIIFADDEHKELKAEYAIDDDPSTFWHTHWDGDYKKHPHGIVIDFGEDLSLTGFTYLPRQDGNNSGNITVYDLYLSADNTKWNKIISDGKFDNVVNNSGLQRVTFKGVEKARYIKLITKGDANNNGWVNAAEIGVINK
jgi:alpha-L-fucosidase